MNNKALNHLILCLTAALISVALTTMTLALIPQKEVILILSIQFIGALMDLMVAFWLYLFIKELLPKQSHWSIMTGGILAIQLLPFVLMIQNILRGTEVYQFNQLMEEPHEPKL